MPSGAYPIADSHQLQAAHFGDMAAASLLFFFVRQLLTFEETLRGTNMKSHIESFEHPKFDS
jgi:hypothetical protein